MDDNQHESERPHPFIKLKNEEGTEDVHYSLFYEGVPSEFEAVALKELNETEENKRKGMWKLRDFMKKENLTDVDDSVLIAVLRNCKYNFKKSEVKLKKFVNVRSFVIDKLQGIDMKRLENALDHKAVGLLPYRDKYGRALLVTTPNINFDMFDCDESNICGLSCALFALTFPLTSITGFAYIGEYKTPSVSVLLPMMNSYRKHTMPMLSLPIRLRRLEVLNESALVRWCLNLIRPLLSSKIIERVSFYGSDIEKLHKFYHPDLLPEEFGGTMDPMDLEPCKRGLLNFMERLKSGRLTSKNAK